MYNRIGLATPRGSGTSGYIQSNKAYKKSNQTKLDFQKQMRRIKQLQAPEIRQPSKEVIDYKKKREIYVILEQLRQDNLDAGMNLNEVEEKIDELEQKMLEKYEKNELDINLYKDTDKKFSDSIQKQNDIKQMKKALKIDKNYKTGEAFDQELQQQKKLEKLVKKEEQKLKELEVKYDRQRKIKKQKRSKNQLMINQLFHGNIFFIIKSYI